MKDMSRICRTSEAAIPQIRKMMSWLRFAGITAAIFGITIFAGSIGSPRGAANSCPATTPVTGCEVSQTFDLPRELAAEGRLKVRDGDYPIGRWQSSEHLVEIGVTITQGKRSNVFLTVGGTRLQEQARTKEGEDCARSKGLAANRSNALERALELISPTVSAAACDDAVRFELVHVSGDRYELQGITSRGVRLYCGTYHFPPQV